MRSSASLCSRPAGSKTYVIDHTAFIYLIDREGSYVAFFPPGTTPERMQVMVRETLTQPEHWRLQAARVEWIQVQHPHRRNDEGDLAHPLTHGRAKRSVACRLGSYTADQHGWFAAAMEAKNPPSRQVIW